MENGTKDSHPVACDTLDAEGPVIKTGPSASRVTGQSRLLRSAEARLNITRVGVV